MLFRRFGENLPPPPQPPDDEHERKIIFSLMSSDQLKFFPFKIIDFFIHQDIKPLIQKKPRYLLISSMMIQPFPTSCPHSQEADETRPSRHLDRGDGHDLEGEYPNGYEFRKHQSRLNGCAAVTEPYH